MLTASLTVRGQSSVRGNFGWSKQNPINEWKYLFGPKPAFIQCKIILLAITSDVCCLSAEESLPVCLHPSPEDGASSTAAGVTSCEVTLQWRAGGESPVREWAMAVHLYVIRPQVLHSGSDVSDGVVRRSICMWNLHKQCVWKLEWADRWTCSPAGCNRVGETVHPKKEIQSLLTSISGYLRQNSTGAFY